MKYVWEEKDISAGVRAKVLVPMTSAGMQIVTVVMRSKEDRDAHGAFDTHRPFRLLQGMNMSTTIPYRASEVADYFTRLNAAPISPADGSIENAK